MSLMGALIKDSPLLGLSSASIFFRLFVLSALWMKMYSPGLPMSTAQGNKSLKMGPAQLP